LTASFHVTGLDHVTITTPVELEGETVAYYRDILFLEQVEKPSGAGTGGAWFRAGGQEVHVTVDPQNPLESPHFCLHVDDFEGVVTQLRSRGFHIEQASAIPGRRRFFTRDPAGNRIEIASYDKDQP
jgi:muramoyltetrapeptide carboxypeptidase